MGRLPGRQERAATESPHYDEFPKVANLEARWLEYPIRDRSAPPDFAAFLILLDRLISILNRADTPLALHYAAGVGRTVTVAIALLVRLRIPPKGALAAVK